MNALYSGRRVSMLLAVVVLACGPKSGQIADKSILTAGAPGRNEFRAGEPGTTTVLKRAYEIAPPLVPHSVAGLEISRSANDCIDCHIDGDEVDDGHVATKIPESHFINKHTGKKSSESVTGNRYQCLQCHVPQADAYFPPGKK